MNLVVMFSALIVAISGCASPVEPFMQRRDAGVEPQPGNYDLSTIGSVGDLSLPSWPCIEGSLCTTANPGACAPGKVSCSGQRPTCVAVAMTQSCYTGRSGSQGVGICKAGTQSCLGSLGSCGDEVL